MFFPFSLSASRGGTPTPVPTRSYAVDFSDNQFYTPPAPKTVYPSGRGRGKRIGIGIGRQEKAEEERVLDPGSSVEIFKEARQKKVGTPFVPLERSPRPPLPSPPPQIKGPVSSPQRFAFYPDEVKTPKFLQRQTRPFKKVNTQ